jgi:hypothetical protein
MKLLAAGFIREILHPDWLANPVLVQKKNTDEWRMCVDYTDLNKHCPKDPFGLLRIDQIVDSTAGSAILSFLDCYSGYHQITLKEQDQNKTYFITPFGAYCYKTMSFGLKNAGATYQRAIQTCLDDQIGENVEAYVDDVVVKTKNPDALIEDLKQTFENLKRWRWKLNPNKCVFRVPSRQLLRFLVSHRGIEASAKQIRAITEMGPPRSGKDVQKLTGCMAALNRFISRLGKKGLPFFKLLRKTDKFEWTEEANEAFKKLKAYLTSSPVLIPLKKDEDMMLYIATTSTMVCTAIVVERQEEGRVYKVQRLVYYISEVLSESKIRYAHVQKLLYALLITSRKLRHYFESHKITVVTDFPLGDILHNRDATRHISKWAVELGALNIDFTPQKAIKSQALADFVAEWTEIQQPMSNTILDHWKMYFDGSLKLGRAGAGVLLISPDGKQLKYVLQILWQATNNEAEYEALIHGLRVAITLGIKRLLVYGDSAVVINQVNKDWDCTKENMGAYCAKI